MDNFLKELALDHRNAMLTSAIDGFDMSLEITGSNVLINDVEQKVIIQNNGSKKNIATKLGLLSIGDIVSLDNKSWLVIDFPLNNDIYLKAEIQLCNSSILLKSETVRVPVLDENGNQVYDEFGDPMSEEIEGDPTTLPCITKTTVTVDSTDEAINLPEGRLDAVIQYTEHDDIQIGKEFTMYGSKYQIIGIDYTKSLNKTGILTIQGKKV